MAGAQLQLYLDAQGVSQEQFAARCRAYGRDWDQSTVSRFVAGRRTLTFEDVMVFLAVLRVPLVKLLDGDDPVVLGGEVVLSSAELRELVTSGRARSLAGSSLEEDDRPVGERVAAALDLSVDEVDDIAYRLWSLPVDDELARRMADSVKAFTGIDPREPRDPMVQFTDPLGRRVDPRRRRAWQGHHERAMTDQLRDELSQVRRGRKR